MDKKQLQRLFKKEALGFNNKKVLELEVEVEILKKSIYAMHQVINDMHERMMNYERNTKSNK